SEGYFEARSLGYITSPGNSVLEWMRLPGDVVFIVGGALPFVWICWLAVRHRVDRVTDRQRDDALFSDEGPVDAAGESTPVGSGRDPM
ncbi:MAG TPA: nitric-oxide reductase large subunit, partial [Actinomycetes bacterium]|nr:nitric-oxide reductase large subunit [Actinomycetes bacterium]